MGRFNLTQSKSKIKEQENYLSDPLLREKMSRKLSEKDF